MPFKKPFFTPKERGPIKKRVAPSDSSKNFGLGGMSPKFFYRYCIACKKTDLSVVLVQEREKSSFFAIRRSLFYRLSNNDKKNFVTYPLDQNFSRNPMVQLVF